MPRYFFDISNGTQSVDDEGVVLPDAAEARRQGILAANAIFGEEIDALASGDTVTMRIRDDNGAVLCTIRCSIHW